MTRAGALRRHGTSTVVVHAAFAATVIALSITGLLTAGGPRWLIGLVGGHDGVAAWHRRVGVGVAARCRVSQPSGFGQGGPLAS